MSEKRAGIPKSVREQVLREFRHHCAACGADRPHVHHIDGDPSINDPLNLIPMCPNCHLQDQHDPTASTDPGKLRLLRRFRDPTVLDARFHPPLFVRAKFLAEISDESDVEELARRGQELTDFVANLEMGKFYSERIAELARRPPVRQRPRYRRPSVRNSPLGTRGQARPGVQGTAQSQRGRRPQTGR